MLCNPVLVQCDLGAVVLKVWRVYRSYHKAHSAGWGNVCCSHCDWREQPPLLIPLVLLHDISGKDIPLLVKPSLVLPLFSVNPAFLTLSFPNSCPSFHFFSRFLILTCPFFLPPLIISSSSLLLFHPHCPPSCPTNMAVFGLWERGAGLCGLLGWRLGWEGARLSPW